MAAELENVERIFQDISNCSYVKSLEILSQSDVKNVNYNLQLQKHKSHLEALKTKLVGLQTQSRFLETLAMENWSPTDSGKMQEHQAHTKEERKKDKQTIEELETEMDNLSKTLCTKHQMIKEKLANLEQRLSATRNKRKEYESLKVKTEEIAGKLKGKENTKETLEEYKVKQLEAESAIRECKAAVSSLEHCKGLLQLEVSRLQDWISGLQGELKTQEAMKKSSDEQQEQHSQWLAGAVELYSNLGGMKVRSAQGDSIALEIPTAARPEDQQDDSPLILTMKFRLEGGTRPVFAGAEVSSHSLFIDDLVDEAIQSRDVVGFTLQVKKRLQNQRALEKEVEELKRNYAMDWEPRDGRVRVMLGRSGKIICTLKVDTLYSVGLGHVTFLGVEGCLDKHDIDQLPTVESGKSLTEWIRELHELFCTQ